MNKRIRNLIIGGIVLILLVGVLLLLKFLPQNTATEEESSTTSYTSTSVELFTKEQSELSQIQLENDAGSVVLHQEQQGEDEDPLYTVDGLEGIDMNTQPSSLFDSLDSVFANQMVEENPTDLAKYGLDSPRATITVTYTDGSSNVLHIGDTLPTGTGCYGQLNDSSTVYALSSTIAPFADMVLTDFVDTTVIETWEAPEATESNPSPATEPEIRSMSVTGGTLTETLGDIPFTFVMGEYDETLAGYGMSGSTWTITSPVHASLHNDNTSAIREGVQGVTAVDVAAIHPDEATLAEYGFDDPYATVDFNRDGEDFHLTVGNSDGNGSRYVMTDGKDVIFVVTEDDLPWISIDLSKTFSSLIYLPYIDDVSQVDLMLNGETYTFEMELSEPEEPEEGEEPEDPTLGRVIYNNEELNLDNYRKMYQFFLSAPAEEIALDQDLEGCEIIASITYHYHDDPSRTDTIDFYQISDRRVALGLNGDITFTSRMAYITRLQQNLEKLLNGETPDLDY